MKIQQLLERLKIAPENMQALCHQWLSPEDEAGASSSAIMEIGESHVIGFAVYERYDGESHLAGKGEALLVGDGEVIFLNEEAEGFFETFCEAVSVMRPAGAGLTTA